MRLEELLAASAQRAPGAVAALEPNGATISYGDLAAYAQDIQDALTAAGVAPGDRVGLCIPKTIGALASVFGAMQAGAAYVPVDVSAPAARNGYIFNDCAVGAIIVARERADALAAELEGPAWVVTPFPSRGADDFVVLTPGTGAARCAPPVSELAYILYTSGSTGRPKGVMHTHASALAFIDWCSAEFAPQASDRFSSHAPFHFDLSILDIYVPIRHGGSVVLIDAETGKQPGVLAALIADQRITMWYSTPTILRMILEYGDIPSRDYSALRVVNFAGEVFALKHLRALMETLPHPAYYNLYGPTETNVCTYYKLPPSLPDSADYALPIGRVCSDNELRIVTPEGDVAADGEAGELVVAGGSVLAGYWNLPERNAEAFLRLEGKDWYRTGDIVRTDPKGDLIFLGRRDRMVKRRGYRVELGEIESALHRHPSIPEAAVVAKALGEGEMEICAFFSWTEEKPASVLKLKQFCAQNLPLYMAPDRFVALPEMPKTSTDKIDYQRLKGLV